MAKKTVEKVETYEGLTKDVLIEKLKHYVKQREHTIEFLTKLNAVIEFLDYEINKLVTDKQENNLKEEESEKDE